MLEYIKSHSNYVLKKNHQTISDGTIWERDITTIGGVNQFSPGQTPIYKSNNFIITVRDDKRVSSQYNTTKWKNNDYGEVWTLENISGMTDDSDGQNDIKIVLKQDYYDFMDFAYYGSLNELMRTSVTDILLRFPGELYGTDLDAYYTNKDGVREVFDEGKFISNPFNIDIHSRKKPDDADELKFFSDGGYHNYEIIKGNSDNAEEITSFNIAYNETSDKICKPSKIAKITISTNSNDYTISACIGDNDEIVYLSNNMLDVHIRPSNKFITKFYDECDNFEKILMNPLTTPRYKSTFSVIKDNEYGYYRDMEDFIFPTSYGGYNIDVTSYGFNDFTLRLSKIGLYYDERFTDNLYRSMTHEAIKNFDWTYTREFENGKEEEYIHGGEKIEKALKVFAREFDEILPYIDNIKNSNRITYDGRNNVPDYFLTDVVSDKGWDVKMIYPYSLKEYYLDENGEKNIVSDETYAETYQLSGVTSDGKPFTREFVQDSTIKVKPYSNKMLEEGYENGYFITCCDGGDELCKYGSDSPYRISAATIGETLFLDECSNTIKNKIKPYTDERPYTYTDVNNEFMRRLVINSPYIARRKGTEEGMEMMLSMFGLKSKKWVESMNPKRMECDYTTEENEATYDYEIVEYTSFTNRIEDPWDAIHQMYRIDWINSTKSIVYDTRLLSNYNRYGSNNRTVSYEGLPVSYRYEYNEYKYVDKSSDQKYAHCAVVGTSDESSAFKVSDTNEPVMRRYLYPNFNKNEQLDGNPYFQMNGGWLSRTVGSGNNKYNFAFDVDNNVAFSKYIESNNDKLEEITDNHPIHTETVRNIRRVDTISEMLSIPSDELKTNSICYVTNIEKNLAIIDGVVYKINFEYYDAKVLKYISFTKTSEYVMVGKDMFYFNTIFVYNRNGEMAQYNISDESDGYEIKAYIKEDGDVPQFICQGDENGNYSITSFEILDNIIEKDGMTNYFILNNVYYSDIIAKDENYDGWRLLSETDPQYVRLNTIVNYYGGNNPHNGNMSYDNGHEYFTYFKRLFKYAMDESMFDERCYDNIENDYDEIGSIGFSNLIDENELVNQYDKLLVKDSKIHYFGSYYKRDNSDDWLTDCERVLFYGEDKAKVDNLKEMYKAVNYKIDVNNYILTDEEKMLGNSNPYSAFSEGTICENGKKIPTDEITNQIVNNKRMTVRFFLHNDWYTNKGQCELKYIDDIVMNYLSQMIPSTTIVNIEYVRKEEGTNA